MRVGPAFRHVQQARRGKEQIVVHHKRAVVYLHKKILPRVVMEQIPRDVCTLRHPIQPKTQAGPVDVVAADRGVNGGMELDARHLRTGKQASNVDVVDGVAGDGAEGRAQAANDARLFAVRDGVVADNMVADIFPRPRDGKSTGTFDGFDVALGSVG